jgi:serine/threonine-protein kinase
VKQQQTNTQIKNFETFGNYLFLKRLAAGGMAEVFLARPASQGGNGRVQVVKRILPHVANNQMFLNMFQTEIQVIMGFNHPQIVQLHDFGEFNGQPYISMEYIEGKNLKEVISKFSEKKEKLPIAMALSLVAQAASGLSYAHTFVNKVTGQTVNAIHRDISPHNLLVSYEGNVKVIDFGIAKAASGMQEATRAGTIKGKIAYLSPEQVSGYPIDARSDVFALGIVAWELLTSQRPFHKDGDSDVTILGRIDNCDTYVVPPSTYNKEIPPEVDIVIMKALKKNPNERYSSASDFQSALRQVMMQYYPSYSYSDTGRLVQKLFAEEIVKERNELRELNLNAQKAIANQLDSSTVVLEHSSPGMVTGVMNNIRNIVPGMNQVDDRLKKIESMMKQKASNRHYLIFAFYVLSLVALKLDDKYSVFNLLFPQKQVSVNVASYGVQKRVPVRAAVQQTTYARQQPQQQQRRTAAAAVVPQQQQYYQQYQQQVPRKKTQTRY